MKKLIFGSSNPHKLAEVKKLMPPSVSLISMQELGIHEELPEEQDTISGNALQKAQELHRLTSMNCFAEDTGLLVDTLDGAPGVYSARFAGKQSTSEENLTKLLRLMEGKENREAHFLTVVALIWEGADYTFEGRVDGHIAKDPKGEGGFGYDPVFIPDGYEKTFGELPQHVKNQISHRARAVGKLQDFLARHS